MNFNMDVAFEIYTVLQNKGIKAADLARLMNKSESEISKWMTGTHNFSLKTIQKIEMALDTAILMTKSAKIAEYDSANA
jgi:transcriptional regulator with XRE-family HTH domain